MELLGFSIHISYVGCQFSYYFGVKHILSASCKFHQISMLIGCKLW